VLNRVPAVADVPSLPFADPQESRRRALEAFGELLARMRDRTPLVVSIDDVQWIDEDSVRLMRALFVRPLAPVLLVLIHRTEGAEANALLRSVTKAALEATPLDVRTVSVGSLTPAALIRCLYNVLPEIDPSLATTLAEEASGSPFLVGELARAAMLQGAGERTRLHDALSTHIRALPLQGQRLLAVLALAGQPLPLQVAIEAASVSDGRGHLDRLRNERLVRTSFDAEGERATECYHDRVREHVADSLDPLRVRELSLGLGRALLTWPGADPELVARTLDAGGLPAQGRKYAVVAAERAVASLAFGRAAALYAWALDRAQLAPAERRPLQIALGDALSYAGQGDRAAAAYREAADGAPGEQAQELRRKAAEQYLLSGDLEQGRELLAESLRPLRIGVPLGLPRALASVVIWRTRLSLRGYAFVPKATHDRAAVQQLEALRTAAHALIRSDQLRGVGFCARWALRALEEGHVVELGRALAWQALIAAVTGASTEKVDELNAICGRLCEETGDPTSVYTLRLARGWQLMMAGDALAALREFDQACTILNAHPSSASSYDRAWVQSYRAMSLVTCGQLAEAGELALAQLEDALARGDHTVSANLTQAACYAEIALDRPARAASLLERVHGRLRANEPTAQDYMWLSVQPMPLLYAGKAMEAWLSAESHRARFLSSFQGRFLLRGLLENETCGLAAAAALRADSRAQRHQLRRIAENHGARAIANRTQHAGLGAPTAVLACVRGRRAEAIAALRKRLAGKIGPLTAQVARRRLGELLDGREGTRLIDEADAFLRAGGVVDPARFTAAAVPGVELL